MLGPRREPFFYRMHLLYVEILIATTETMLIYLNHRKINYCKEIIHLLTTDLFVLSFELTEANVCAVFVVNELRRLSNQIYIK